MRRLRTAVLAIFAASLLNSSLLARSVEEDLERIGTKRGVVALVGLPAEGAEHIIGLARASELVIYFQSDDSQQVGAVREAAHEAGLLGKRVFADHGSLASVHLSDNLADCIVISASAKGDTPDAELLRAMRPRATAFIVDRELVKPVPEGIDEWTHPFHGPDNNPQSNDQHVRGAFRTQFLSDPKFSPMPEQSVAAGGRVYKAMGHIAHKANQNEMLNTLLCINAYNGTILWKRPLSPGFMIHRNTMIATDDALYMGDHESCKVIDARTGEVRREITVPIVTDGPVWKWMAMRDGVLYALVGNPEIEIKTQRSSRRGLGHWPWGMWDGHDYDDPRTAFGFGRTLVAIDLETNKVIWHHTDEEFLDARGVCMNDDSIYCFSAERFLMCIDRNDGVVRWRNADKDLLEAVGPNQRAQHYITGYATSAYIKCTNDYVLFAGPQRAKMVVASAKDGKLAWSHPHGNLQLVLRDDAIYAAGPETTGVKLAYDTGEQLGSLPTRRACTRATGCADSIFYRTSGGTVRVMTETYAAHHIAPMRPPCQDGVLVSNGHLYWGPWMCGCQLSLYGNICLGTANGPRIEPADTALQVADRSTDVKPLGAKSNDWPSYRSNNARTDVSDTPIPSGVELSWKARLSDTELPTAPVVAGGLVFVADRSGAVQAFDSQGEAVWKYLTAGPIFYAPAVAHDRLYVGSADGRVYALEAKTGRFLWSYRVAPEQRWISVYGKLISTWPVAGGVVVHDGSVFAAAGIAHYDGTYVVKLDALSGKLLASNNDSGALSPEVNSGISMQGNMMVVGDELQFLAGGVYEIARYDTKTLRCLNEPKPQVTSQYRTAFYPYYPSYGKYVSLDHTRADGSLLSHNASYEGNAFTNLALDAPLPGGEQMSKQVNRWNYIMRLRRRGIEPPPTLWKDKTDRRFTSFVLSDDTLLAAGHPEAAPEETFLASINVRDGKDTWLQKLPSLAVKGGTALDGEGRIFVTVESGELLCFAPVN